MFKNRSQNFILAIFVIIITVLGYYFAEGPNIFWWLLWFVPLPVLLYSLYQRFLATFLVGFVSFAVSLFAVTCGYYCDTMMPLLHFIPLSIGYGVIMAILITLNSFVVRKVRAWYVIFFFPVLMVIYSYLVYLIGQGNLISVSGFSQYPFLIVMQLTKLTGIWGIVFLLAFIPNVLAVLWFFRKNTKIFLSIIVATTVLLVAVFGYGFYQQHQIVNKDFVRVGLAVQNPQSYKRLLSDSIKYPNKMLVAYIARLKVLAKQKAQYIMQPEMGLIVTKKTERTAINKISQIARKYKTTILLPLTFIDDKKIVRKNYLLVIAPSGKIVAKYYKHHLVQFAEGQAKRGRDLIQLPYKNYKLGVAICHDMDFANPARKYGKLNVALLFVPAADFGINSDAWWHARFALVQSISNGYALARAALFGYLTISDANGALIAKKPSKINEPTYMVVNVPLSCDLTFYAKYGNWFAWLCIVLCVLLILKCIAYITRK
ncbi:MAG: nitrilase-related carbon-nitrogen hydrolase [Gammaproteobacteria bacterium]|jgi:apolipoprotein N-acyltransferase